MVRNVMELTSGLFKGDFRTIKFVRVVGDRLLRLLGTIN
jgi:hypothetical protein